MLRRIQVINANQKRQLISTTVDINKTTLFAAIIFFIQREDCLDTILETFSLNCSITAGK
jgi:hypothetical protein